MPSKKTMYAEADSKLDFHFNHVLGQLAQCRLARARQGTEAEYRELLNVTRKNAQQVLKAVEAELAGMNKDKEDTASA